MSRERNDNVTPRVTRSQWANQQALEANKPTYSNYNFLQSDQPAVYRAESHQDNPFEKHAFFQSLKTEMQNADSKRLLDQCGNKFP